MWVEIQLAKLTAGEAAELLAFQDVNEAAGQSFMVCFATHWQLEFAAARGDTAILLDATHSTNQLKVCPLACLSQNGQVPHFSVNFFLEGAEKLLPLICTWPLALYQQLNLEHFASEGPEVLPFGARIVTSRK